MAKQNTLEMVGGYLFILGVIIAIIGGLMTGYESTLIPVLAVFGLIVGILNITDKEINGYLIAVIALILLNVVANGILSNFWTPIASMFGYIAVFAAFGGIFPALKKMYEIASSK